LYGRVNPNRHSATQLQFIHKQQQQPLHHHQQQQPTLSEHSYKTLPSRPQPNGPDDQQRPAKSQGQLYEHIWSGTNQQQQQRFANTISQPRSTPSIDDQITTGLKNLEVTSSNKPNNILIEKNLNQLPLSQPQSHQSQLKYDATDSVEPPHHNQRHHTVSTSALLSSSSRVNGFTSSGNLNGQRVIHRLNGSEPFVEESAPTTVNRNYENQLVGHMQQQPKIAAKPSIPNKPLNVNKPNGFQQHQVDEEEIRLDLIRQRMDLLQQLESKPQGYRTNEEENHINKLKTEIEFDRRVFQQQQLQHQNGDEQYEQEYTPEVRERITMQMQVGVV